MKRAILTTAKFIAAALLTALALIVVLWLMQITISMRAQP